MTRPGSGLVRWCSMRHVGYDDDSFSAVISFEDTRDPQWYRTVGVRVDPKTGVMPYARYVVRERGKIEVGNLACAMCHTRVLDDGTVIRGAQGNFPFDRSIAFGMRAAVKAIGNPEQATKELRRFDSLLFGMPWRSSRHVTALRALDLEGYIAAYEAIPPGVAARHGTSPLLPVQIPDLIGVQDRRYLDCTGLIRHRDAGDLMRYAALNQGADFLTHFGGFVPGGPAREELPPSQGARYSDLQLRALAQFVYALQPPANPHVRDAAEDRQLVERGQATFRRLRCGRCHTPPAFTSNALTPVDGFEVPSDRTATDEIIEESVGTDPGLSLDTRRGTGFYKVPSLRGVWYRGPFEHHGSVATLEDWFDPRRLLENYAPTGWKGPPSHPRRGVTGHRFGLESFARRAQRADCISENALRSSAHRERSHRGLPTEWIAPQNSSRTWRPDASTRCARCWPHSPALVNAVGPHPYWGGRPQPLHLAIEGKRRDVFDLLLDSGADIDGRNDEYRPLVAADDRDQRIDGHAGRTAAPRCTNRPRRSVDDGRRWESGGVPERRDPADHRTKRRIASLIRADALRYRSPDRARRIDDSEGSLGFDAH